MMLLKKLLVVALLLFADRTMAQMDLRFYIEQAQANSPLILDNKNQSEAAKLETERLRAFYKKAQVSITGIYQFSPIISRDNGRTDLVMNPSSAEKYSGYDIAASNGGIYQGFLNVNQPLFNDVRYKTTAEQITITSKINENTIRLTAHDLERFVTDQYILCLQDLKQTQYLMALLRIIDEQKNMVSKMAESGLVKQSDKSLLTIEQRTQQAALSAFKATYRRDLMDLRVLAGVADTTFQILPPIMLERNEQSGASVFTERYRLDSLNLAATQRIFELKYKPLVGVYGNVGLDAVYAPTIPNRFGMSAGVNFAWTITDGHQRDLSRQRTSVLMKSAQNYRSFFYRQNSVRKDRILTELKSIAERITILTDQNREYQQLLEYYKQELSSGQISVINYVTTLKSLASSQRDFVLLETNQQLLINLYNYWNW